MGFRNVLMLAASLIAFVPGIYAENCNEVAVLAQIVHAKSTSRLPEDGSGNSYRLRLVTAYRRFQLQPRSKPAAEGLLREIPANDSQQTEIMTMGDSLCKEESLADMESLAQVSEGFAGELTRAVLVAPEFLPEYVQYSVVAVSDPHSDYAVQMKKGCKPLHAKFIRAVRQMPEQSRQLFTGHVMNPDTCSVIAFPEGR